MASFFGMLRRERAESHAEYIWILYQDSIIFTIIFSDSGDFCTKFTVFSPVLRAREKVLDKPGPSCFNSFIFYRSKIAEMR